MHKGPFYFNKNNGTTSVCGKGKAGFEFDRNAKGSHEIWWNPANRKRTTAPNHRQAVREDGDKHCVMIAMLQSSAETPVSLLGSRLRRMWIMGEVHKDIV